MQVPNEQFVYKTTSQQRPKHCPPKVSVIEGFHCIKIIVGACSVTWSLHYDVLVFCIHTKAALQHFFVTIVQFTFCLSLCYLAIIMHNV